jgi:hypothetical protein
MTQLDLQFLHRVRDSWVMRRTAVINQIRGLLLERGTTVRQGDAMSMRHCPAEYRISPRRMVVARPTHRS